MQHDDGTPLGTPATGPSDAQPDAPDDALPESLGDTVPDSWAPVNRIGQPMRNEVDWFRNTRVRVPESLDAALSDLALALELYETVRETEHQAHAEHAMHLENEPAERERAIAYLLDADPKAKVPDETRAAALVITRGRSAGSLTAAEKLVDVVPFIAAFNRTTRRLHGAKLHAEKEVSIARRRHDTCKLFADRLEVVHVTHIARPTIDLGEAADDILSGRRDVRDVMAHIAGEFAPRAGVAPEPIGATGHRGGWKQAPDAPVAGFAETSTTDDLTIATGEKITRDTLSEVRP